MTGINEELNNKINASIKFKAELIKEKRKVDTQRTVTRRAIEDIKELQVIKELFL